MEAMMGICTTDNIVRRLRGISAKTGVVLRYNEVNLMTGSGPVLHHRVERASGSKWVPITDAVKTQRVLWKRVLIWEELAEAIGASRSGREAG